MSDVTVKQLAEVVKTPVNKLIEQLNEAGIPVKKSEDVVSDDQKMKLLDHLRQSHGKTTGAQKTGKITLNRKRKTEIKVGAANGSRRHAHHPGFEVIGATLEQCIQQQRRQAEIVYHVRFIAIAEIAQILPIWDVRFGNQGDGRIDQTHGRVQHLTARKVGDVTRMPLTKTDQYPPLSVHILHTQACLVAVTPDRTGQYRQYILRLNTTNADEVVQQHLLLGIDLCLGGEVLQTAATAHAEMRTLWRHAVH